MLSGVFYHEDEMTVKERTKSQLLAFVPTKSSTSSISRNIWAMGEYEHEQAVPECGWRTVVTILTIVTSHNPCKALYTERIPFLSRCQHWQWSRLELTANWATVISPSCLTREAGMGMMGMSLKFITQVLREKGEKMLLSLIGSKVWIKI